MAFDNPSVRTTSVRHAANPVDVHVGRQLKLARKNRGVSQEALADALGLTFQQVQKYETGANRMSASKMYAAALFLRLETSFFFAGLPDTLQGAAGDMAVPAHGHAMVDQRHGRELQAAFLVMSEEDRAMVTALAQRIVTINAVGAFR